MTLKVESTAYTILVLLGWFLHMTSFNSKAMPTNDTDCSFHIHSFRTCLTNHNYGVHIMPHNATSY